MDIYRRDFSKSKQGFVANVGARFRLFKPVTYLRAYDLMATWQVWNEARKALRDGTLTKTQAEELIGPEKLAELRAYGLAMAKSIAGRKFSRKPPPPTWLMSKLKRDYSTETFEPIATFEDFQKEIRGRMGEEFFDCDFDQRVFTLVFQRGKSYDECKIIMGSDYLAQGFKLYSSWMKFLGRN